MYNYSLQSPSSTPIDPELGQSPQIHTNPLVRYDRALEDKRPPIPNNSFMEDSDSSSSQTLEEKGSSLGRSRSSVWGKFQSRKQDANLTQVDPTRTPTRPRCDWWRILVVILTFWALPPCMNACGIRTKEQQQAWKEKVALCLIILALSIFVGYLTFGFTMTACGAGGPRVKNTKLAPYGLTAIRGQAYSTDGYMHPSTQYGAIDVYSWSLGRDIGFLFPSDPQGSACQQVLGPNFTHWPCTVPGVWPRKPDEGEACHMGPYVQTTVQSLPYLGQVYYDWEEVAYSIPSLNQTQNGHQVVVKDPAYIVFNGYVLNVFRYLSEAPQMLGDDFMKQVVLHLGTDATQTFRSNSAYLQRAQCLNEIFRVGLVDPRSVGCVIADAVLYLAFAVVLSVLLAKFLLALVFHWFIAPEMGDISARRKKFDPRGLCPRRNNLTSVGQIALEPGNIPSPSDIVKESEFHDAAAVGDEARREVFAPQPRTGARLPAYDLAPGGAGIEGVSSMYSLPPSAVTDKSLFNYKQVGQSLPDGWRADLLHVMMMVTCYTEGENSIRTTLDSLALTDYPDERKIIIVVCDGIVQGAGNDKPTSDIVTDMILSAPDVLAPIRFPEPPPPMSYVAIAEGSKRHNKARVHGGYYKGAWEQAGRRVPMIAIIKCGNEQEAQDPSTNKPGNRGKRDSQVMLMNFLSKVLYDDRLSEFEYDLFDKIWALGGVPPDRYETLLMVDADTKVYTDSIRHMVACMMRDPTIMGLCGETKIENKMDSWVTMIQVFEYHISHHLSKAFESVFGGVTCLPGCFTMYRIKAPKGPDGYYVPILANPDVIVKYAENAVDTLHEKNLYLLGEDRYLTTLMLKAFPKRKLVFVLQARCKTIVPDKFKVLLSQRRRWINSTVHNLMELVLIRDLCGTFCISMQFVIFVELIGTVVLPAAICFTIYLIIAAFITVPPPIIPLVLLLIIILLPVLLVLLTTFNLKYLFWAAIYIVSLPIWNFVLPLYAFWHFDDFSWGSTRKVEGDSGKGHLDGDGVFDGSSIVLRRWVEWEKCQRQAIVDELVRDIDSMSSVSTVKMSRQPSMRYNVQLLATAPEAAPPRRSSRYVDM